LGCGTGRHTIILKKRGAKVWGLDLSPKMLEIAKAEIKGVDFGNIVNITKARSDFGDIRFTDSSANLLNYWIESVNTGINATFWVQIAGNLTLTNQTIYIYYNNSIMTNVSNGDSTFLFFDHFDNPSNSLNTTKWSTSGTGTNPVASSKVNVTTSASAGWRRILSTSSFGNNTALYMYMRRQDGGQTGSEEEWGFNMSSSPDTNCVCYWASAYYAGVNFDPISLKSGSATSITGNVVDDNNYHIIKMMRANSTTNLYQVDNNAIQNISSNIPTVNLPATLTARMTNDFIEADWLFVRKYVSPEPSHGIWGSEES
jgi:hypothetical protein